MDKEVRREITLSLLKKYIVDEKGCPCNPYWWKMFEEIETELRRRNIIV